MQIMHNKLFIPLPLLFLSVFLGLIALIIIEAITNLNPAITATLGIMVSVLSYAGLSFFCKWRKNAISKIYQTLDETAIEVILGGVAGLLLGIIVGVLSSIPLNMLRGVGAYLTLIVFIISVWLGWKTGTRRAFDVFRALPLRIRKEEPAIRNQNSNKVLDTSAIIDGRIYDVYLSKFLEGTLIVPTFVIEELQHIADSSDTLRRNKGRRGLELLSKMQKHPAVKIDIIETDIGKEKNVDAELVSLCKGLNASIITNDYNLNKVAELQGIKVLNINELTNAVKMMVYPGETMQISIIKEGKEHGQGIGYLEDGTMVVVEEAQNEIGKDLGVVVTSVFQTAAGRMIFTRKAKEIREGPEIIHSLHDTKEVNLYG